MRRWLLAIALYASAVKAATLRGVVLDASRRPVAGATVQLQSKTVKSDSDGSFRFDHLSEGSYMLLAKGKSFGPFVLTKHELKRVELAVSAPAFDDEPTFVVAGVTAGSYQGGHGSDVVLRSTEELTKATASLSADRADEQSENALEAVRGYQRAAQLDPTERNLFDWGTELLKHRADQAAFQVFTKGERLFPSSVRILLGLAAASYSLGASDEAARLFFAACDLDPTNPTPYLFLGKVRDPAIRGSAAFLEHLRRFAEIHPENPQANYLYAAGLWAQRKGSDVNEKSGAAKALLEKAVQLDSKLGPAYLLLGTVEFEGADFKKAIAAFLKAIEVSPELEEAHYRLAQAYRLTGDTAGAQKELARYDQISKRSADQLQRERRELPRFVITLRTQ